MIFFSHSAAGAPNYGVASPNCGREARPTYKTVIRLGVSVGNLNLNVQMLRI